MRWSVAGTNAVLVLRARAEGGIRCPRGAPCSQAPRARAEGSLHLSIEQLCRRHRCRDAGRRPCSSLLRRVRARCRQWCRRCSTAWSATRSARTSVPDCPSASPSTVRPPLPSHAAGNHAHAVVFEVRQMFAAISERDLVEITGVHTDSPISRMPFSDTDSTARVRVSNLRLESTSRMASCRDRRMILARFFCKGLQRLLSVLRQEQQHLLQHLLHSARRQCGDEGCFARPPVQTLELIRQNHAGHL